MVVSTEKSVQNSRGFCLMIQELTYAKWIIKDKYLKIYSIKIYSHVCMFYVCICTYHKEEI